MQNLTVKDVILTEYEKLVKHLEKNNLEIDLSKMSNLELAGNLYSEFDGDIKKIQGYINAVNKETNYVNKFRFYTVLDICKIADMEAAELFEHPTCSMPGTLISKICSQSKGFPISDEIYNKYFSTDASQHQINLRCYYSVQYNRKDKIYYLIRDLDKSPRKPVINDEKAVEDSSVDETPTLNVATKEENTDEKESYNKVETEETTSEDEE